MIEWWISERTEDKSSGGGLLDDEAFAARDFACETKDSASAKYPFRTHVSIRSGISNKSLIFSCCSKTMRALLRSLSTDSVLSFHPAAHSSRAGRLEVSSESSDEDSEDREVVRALVV